MSRFNVLSLFLCSQYSLQAPPLLFHRQQGLPELRFSKKLECLETRARRFSSHSKSGHLEYYRKDHYGHYNLYEEMFAWMLYYYTLNYETRRDGVASMGLRAGRREHF